jgi:hypothetical protein
MESSEEVGEADAGIGGDIWEWEERLRDFSADAFVDGEGRELGSSVV